jgi:hypothetical protein
MRTVAKYFMKWQMNHTMIPANPEERGKLWISMLEMVRAEMKSGALVDWGVYTDSSAGYTLAETDEKSLHAMVLKWIPYVVFNSKPVLTVDQCIANIKQAAAGVKR